MIKVLFYLLFTILLLTWNTGLAQKTNIGKILESPTRYQNKIVKVKGVVVNSYEVPFLHFFKIKDKNGDEIHVITEKSVPSENEEVRIKGKVNRLYKIGKHQFLVVEELEEDNDE